MKNLLLLAFAVINLSIYAQEATKQCELTSLSPQHLTKHYQKTTNNKAPGDVLWSEDFSGGLPSGWVLNDNGVGGFQFIDADTAYTGAYTKASEAMINSLTHANGYMHLPADFYNCKPDVWPREIVDSPQDIDATMETSAIDVSNMTNGGILQFDAWWRLCCSETETKLDVNVGWYNTNTSSWVWTTFNGRDANGVVGINDYPNGGRDTNVVTPLYFISSIIDSANGTNGENSIKIQFRMHGGSHYFWSIDDIKIQEPYGNNISLKDYYAGNPIYTVSKSNYKDFNINYSEVPGNISVDVKFGALVHQAGANAENLKVNFDVSKNGTSIMNFDSDTIANFSGGMNADTILLSTDSLHLYNPNITSNENYLITYKIVSDNDDNDTTDNMQTYPITQTLGRYSYHHDDTPESQISLSGYTSYSSGDKLAVKYSFYQDSGVVADPFKIYGMRFYIGSKTNLDGNNITLRGVLLRWDSVISDYEEIMETDSYVLTSEDIDTFHYIKFDEDDVNYEDFEEGVYLIAIQVFTSGDAKFYVGEDQSYSQGKSVCNMYLEGQWYYGGTNDAAIMIDAYTNLEAYENDACKGVPQARFTVNQTVINQGESVQFKDHSTCLPNAWEWEFEGGTPSTSTEQNPQITYNNPGIYQVKLLAKTDVDSNELIRTNYIYVNPDLIVDIVTHNASCGEANGSAEISIEGGSGDYNILWSDGTTGTVVEDLSAGNYSVQITDTSYHYSVIKYLNIENSDLTLTLSQTNTSCYNTTDGTASVDISGGTEPYQYIWSNCETTQSISNLSKGTYTITVTDVNGCFKVDTIEINSPNSILISTTETKPSCGNADGELTVTPSGGTGSYVYNWSNGETTASISNLSSGIYDLTISDGNACQAVFSVGLSDDNDVIITTDSVFAAQCNKLGSVYVSVTGGSGTYDYNWSNGEETQDLESFSAGNYSLELTDGSCKTFFLTSIPAKLPSTPEICVATVWPDTKGDLIIWEKPQVNIIDYYNVYRETVKEGEYQLLGSVPYDDMSVFYTTEVCKFNQSWKYKLTAVDVCGNESEKSYPHKPIRLNVHREGDNVFYLSWDNYIGFDYDGFHIYRETLDDGNWEKLRTVSRTTHNFTDDTYTGSSDLRYWVGVDIPSPCVPTSTDRASGGPYYQSSSNIEDEGLIDTQVSSIDSDFNINLFPNPNNGLFTVGFSQTTAGRIEVLDISGKVLISDNFTDNSKWVNTKSLETGIYFVKINLANEGVQIIKMIVE